MRETKMMSEREMLQEQLLESLEDAARPASTDDDLRRRVARVLAQETTREQR